MAQRKHNLKRIPQKLSQYKFEIIFFTITFTLLSIVRIFFPVVNIDETTYNDFTCYIEMAEDITSIFRNRIIQPYIHRVVVPFLAGIMPFSITINFMIIGLISYYLILIMLYLTLKQSFNQYFSLLGVIIFLFISLTSIYFNIFLFYYVYLVDMTAFLMILCCFYFILKNKKILFSIFLFIGIFIKESVFFVIPVFLLYNLFNSTGLKGKKEKLFYLIKLFCYIVPIIISYMAFEMVIQPDSVSNHPFWYDLYNQNEYGTIGMLIAIGSKRLTEFDSIVKALLIWNVLLIFILLNSKEELMYFIKVYGFFFILVYAQLFLAVGSIRLVYLGFYPMIYLSLSGIGNLIESEYMIQEFVYLKLDNLIITPSVYHI